jgi:hypothetical protein
VFIAKHCQEHRPGSAANQASASSGKGIANVTAMIATGNVHGSVPGWLRERQP